MTSNEEQLELLPREKYISMDFETLVKAIESIDLSFLDRARTFQPRKQRSCCQRAEPVTAEEHRRMEKNERAREYTKRNQDEISNCRFLFNELYEVKGRLEELLKEYKVEVVGKKLTEFVAGFENILNNYFTVKLHELCPFVSVYGKKIEQVMKYEMPTSNNVYATKLVELEQQLATLHSKKDTMIYSSFWTSKSRLNQRIIRDQWKSECWECWNDIQTLVLRGQELKKLVDQLKKQVWDNILAAHYHMFGLFNQQHKSQFDIQQIEETVEYFAPFARSPGTFIIKWTPVEESPSFAPPTAPASYVPFRASPCLPAQDSSIPSSSNALDMTSQVERSKTRIQEEIEKQMNRKRTAPSSFNDESEIKRKPIEGFKTSLLETLLASAPSITVQQSIPIPSSSTALEKSAPKVADTLIKSKSTALPPTAETKQSRKPISKRPRVLGFSKTLLPSAPSSSSFAPPSTPASSVPSRKSPFLPTHNISIPSSFNASDTTSEVEKKTEKSVQKDAETLVNWKRAALASFDVRRKPVEDLQKPAPTQSIGVQKTVPYNPRPQKTSPLQASRSKFLMAMEQQRMMMDDFLQQAFQRK